MYPFFRLMTTSIKSMRAVKLDVFDASETTFRARPWDLDIFMEVNNGRLLTLYDLGRFDLAIRIGLTAILRKNKWGLVVAGSSTRYRRRVRMFDKVTMRTQVIGMDEKWVYIAQSIWVQGRPTSSALLRTGVTAGGKVIPTTEIAAAFGLAEWNTEITEIPDWVQAWIDADAGRDWPPKP